VLNPQGGFPSREVTPPTLILHFRGMGNNSQVRFFLWMSTIFSICRLLLSLVHCLGEVVRHRAYRVGSRLYVSHVFSHHRANGIRAFACYNLQQAEDIGLRCPVCTTGPQITERQGIAIAYCPQCRGAW
jgi:hypothetical protein